MLPTNLNKKITFLEKPKNVGEFQSTTSEVVYKCYANIKYLTSNTEIIQQYMTDAKIGISFRVFNTKFTSQLPYKTTEYSILFEGNIYNIYQAIPDSSNNYIDIKGFTML